MKSNQFALFATSDDAFSIVRLSELQMNNVYIRTDHWSCWAREISFCTARDTRNETVKLWMPWSTWILPSNQREASEQNKSWLLIFHVEKNQIESNIRWIFKNVERKKWRKKKNYGAQVHSNVTTTATSVSIFTWRKALIGFKQFKTILIIILLPTLPVASSFDQQQNCLKCVKFVACNVSFCW